MSFEIDSISNEISAAEPEKSKIQPPPPPINAPATMLPKEQIRKFPSNWEFINKVVKRSINQIHSTLFLLLEDFLFILKSQISFVSRTRGVKDSVLDTLSVDPALFEGSPERRRGSHTGGSAGKMNGQKASFKKSQSFC